MMRTSRIAPCGMNCGVCYAFLREKNRCPGCRAFAGTEPVSIARCKIRNCEEIRSGEIRFCFECKSYPCKNLNHLDTRYRTRYHMSQIENLEVIRRKGIRRFVQSEEARWFCPDCGGTICVHKGCCCNCGRKK